MCRTFTADARLLEDVHALSDCRVDETDVLNDILDFLAEGHSLEVWLEPMESVADFVQGFLLGHGELAGSIDGVGFEEVSHLVPAVQKVLVARLKPDAALRVQRKNCAFTDDRKVVASETVNSICDVFKSIEISKKDPRIISFMMN